MYDFDYTKANNLDEATAALAAADGTGMLLGGGQTLIPTLKQRLAMPATLIDITGIDELRGVRSSADVITVGAATTHAAVASNPAIGSAIPALAGLAGGIGDPQVRNLGTIGGSLANNDPAADYPAAALALSATIVTERRRIPADEYFQGFYTTALEEGEIIVAVEFPVPDFAAYARFEQRASRFPLVGVFVAKSGGAVRTAITGAGSDGVFRCAEIEAALGRDWSLEALATVNVPSDNLVSDLHASADYRAALIPVLARRAIFETP